LHSFGKKNKISTMEMFKRFKRLPYLIQFLYEKVTTSIAFYPMLMVFGFFLFTGLMFYLEAHGLTAWMDERLPPFLLIKSWNVAQSLLTTLVGALISLMVFSFSMVMVLLNNAASNFSPRILPSLISNKFHQFVLGTYLGTIVYCLLMVLNMTPNQDKLPLPGFSVLLGIVFGVTCLLLFVFFIHSISESVQVGKILQSIHTETTYNMRNGTISQLSNEALPKDIDKWKSYTADRSGYLQSVNFQLIGKICVEENIKVKVLIPESRFVFEGAELFICNKNLEKDIKNKILEYFVLSVSESAEKDHIVGFKQITEIALKAMSPGINDPGTALSCINYLTILFTKKMKLPETGAVKIENENKKEESLPNQIWLSVIGFDELLSFVLAPLRQYARHDLIVMLKMLEMLKFLASRNHCTEVHLKIIQREVEILRVDAEEYLTNSADYNKIIAYINTFPKKTIIA